MLRQFALFVLVGALGFVVDAGVLLLLAHVLDLNIYLARVLSWLAAATFTWRLNRVLTFADARTDSPWRQWLRFLGVNMGGGLINLSVSMLLIGALQVGPVLAVACGSLAGLAWNFLLSRRLVFVTLRDGRHSASEAPVRADPGHRV